MSMSMQDKLWHDEYEKLPNNLKQIVDMSFNDMQRTILVAGLKAAKNDVAEQLIAAITRYVIESNE